MEVAHWQANTPPDVSCWEGESSSESGKGKQRCTYFLTCFTSKCVPSLSSWFLELMANTAGDKDMHQLLGGGGGGGERGRDRQYDSTDLH